MGAHPFWYFEEFTGDVSVALERLREHEFQAGRYNPVISFPEFPPGPDSPAPGAQHDSIEDAMADAAEEGTRSILDLHRVADAPDFFAASPVDSGVLEALYGTNQPTREMIEENMEFLEEVERGQGVYILVYKDGKPHQVFFAGYSFD